MTMIKEDLQAGAFLASEANGTRSREVGTLAAGNHKAGTVLALNGSGDYVIVAPAAENGTETAVAVLYAAADASEGPAPCVVVARDAEVNKAELIWPTGITAPQTATALGQLAAAGIIARDSV